MEFEFAARNLMDSKQLLCHRESGDSHRVNCDPICVQVRHSVNQESEIRQSDLLPNSRNDAKPCQSTNLAHLRYSIAAVFVEACE